MASLIPGFEYDVFISYRQKDNKYDGWVTEFVDNLKKELEATFKEDISVYFDINPHDGLLETHDVDASLKEKLKCLVFIPIISRTYCDTKSFAWEHEFKAFVEQSSQDQYGLKVKLPNGNVANRVLPVQIHDLYTEDKAIVEEKLGGVLRAIEFIYKEPGVNRPLTAKDNENKNINRTNYRNQINKVANAIRDIIDGLRSPGRPNPNDSQVSNQEKQLSIGSRRTKIISGLFLLLAFVVAGYFIINRLNKSKQQPEKSIAVLPFINDSPSDSNKYFINGIMEEILNNLQKIKDFRVVSRTSTDQYKDRVRPTVPEIARKLKVNYIIEGSGQKYGNKFVLRVQLIAAKNERHLWAKSFDREIKRTSDIINIQSEIAQLIATELKTTITPEEKLLIERSPTTNLTAYNLFLKAEDYKKEYIKSHALSSYETSLNLYNEALEYDSVFARAYTGLAELYYNRYFYQTYFKENFLDTVRYYNNKALKINDHLDLSYYLEGWICGNYGDAKGALYNFDMALTLNPNNALSYRGKGMTLILLMDDFVHGIENYQKALTLIQGEERPAMIRRLARAYLDAGFIEKARSLCVEAYNLDGRELDYLSALAWIEFNSGNFLESVKAGRKATAIDSTFDIDLFIYNLAPNNGEEAFQHAKKLAATLAKRGELSLSETHRIGYAFYMKGKFKEADSYFKEQIRYGEEGIKLNRFMTQRRSAYYDLAATYAFVGQKEKAYKYLNEFATRDFFPLWWIILIKNDPLFKSIQNEARFQNIIHDMQNKYNAEHERVRKWLEEQGKL
jgi:TolB-like protein